MCSKVNEGKVGKSFFFKDLYFLFCFICNVVCNQFFVPFYVYILLFSIHVIEEIERDTG